MPPVPPIPMVAEDMEVMLRFVPALSVGCMTHVSQNHGQTGGFTVET